MLDRTVRLFFRGDTLCGGHVKMQEKKDQPGQGDMGGSQKQWPDDEAGKQGGQGQGDVGKKGGSGDVDRGGGQGGPEKKL
jgi:hypothetical protein